MVPSASRIRSAARSDGATPNTVGPLPDITAPTRLPPTSAAFISVSPGHSGAPPRSSLFASAAATAPARAERRHQRVDHTPSP